MVLKALSNNRTAGTSNYIYIHKCEYVKCVHVVLVSSVQWSILFQNDTDATTK